MTSTKNDDRVLNQLVTLAQAQRTEPPWRERQFLDQLEDRLLERRRARVRARRRQAVAAAVVACMVALVSFSLLRPTPLRYEVAGGGMAEGYIVSRGDTKVRFSDGSQVALAPDTRVRVSEVTAHGSRLELERGQATVSVEKAPLNAWFVAAGPYMVHVTGTAFDVRWSKNEERFELDLHHGAVVITGPPIQGAISLKAGQKLISVPSGTVTVPSGTVTVRNVASAKASALAEPTPSSAETEKEPARAQPEVPVREASANDPTWARLVARGKFQEVIDAARARGLKDVLGSGHLEDLAALADAARYARNPDIARQALLSARRRFPGSRLARDAAFFLGGLEDREGTSSIDWYERYLAESPNGSYTSQALGRRFMLVYRDRGADAATPLAKSYIERFPKGPYASAARRILDRQQP